ncbi:TPA: phage holin family protein [Acinetobacter baumannii]|uniref:phage holin family protein n=1 Tax=Acinetobacter baumannii TaxID=470 RepID=UPI0013BC15B1|nr:phage holin family protein [Acinetobacter baumannii]EHU1429318.1 phage holin family protein [Acinetobacter baumannii]EHU1559148.1 phage holin family protein [Acinetobacter baumannii]EJB8577442.1 phage holin family protein [Acinetobacter baumannii]MCG5907036.1 phage holin family protein [Acinetobacter baumannii]MDC4541495.1 phage holin family protein [Acinetobacter baumannii]
MIELIFQTIAVLAYLICGFRIVSFSHGGNFHRGYSILAAVLIAAFFGQSIHILFFKDPVTLFDAVFAVVLAILILRTKGNVAKLIWSTS